MKLEERYKLEKSTTIQERIESIREIVEKESKTNFDYVFWFKKNDNNRISRIYETIDAFAELAKELDFKFSSKIGTPEEDYSEFDDISEFGLYVKLRFDKNNKEA